MSRKLYIIAGEPSGDLHGAHLVRALQKEDPEIIFRGFGGPKMAEAGVRLDQTLDKLSYMGFAEVIKHLPQIRKNFSLAKKAIQDWQPDGVIFVDFPGFNMRMAKWTRAKGYRNFYYIAPQAWAWKASRAEKLKKYVDELFCILPFEEAFFDGYGLKVHYVGHPLVDIIREYFDRQNPEAWQKEEKVLAVLPGSRVQEVQKILPVQLEACRFFPGHRIVVGRSPNVPVALYEEIIKKQPVQPEMADETYPLLYRTDLACVASGTATLETALFHVPEVVCYKGSGLSYQIAKRLVKVPYISLVNLIMGKKIIPELIQSDLTGDRLAYELNHLTDPEVQRELSRSYKELEKKLGVGGAAAKTAKIILTCLSNAKDF